MTEKELENPILKAELEKFDIEFYPDEFANDGDRQYWEELNDWINLKHFLSSSLTRTVLATLDSLEKRLPEEYTGIEDGSEFATPRDYRKSGFNNALSEVQEAIKQERDLWTTNNNS